MKNLRINSLIAVLLLCLVACSWVDNSIPLAFERLSMDISNDDYYKGTIESEKMVSLKSLKYRDGHFAVFAKIPEDQDIFMGRTIELMCSIKTENITEGYAGLWFRIDGREDEEGFYDMKDRGITGTNGWMTVSVTINIPQEVEYITVGGILSGNGNAWFKDLRIVPADGKGRFIPVEYAEPTEHEIAWLRRYIHPLRTCRADGESDEDLKVLGDMIGDATVVGLGEVTHGSREIFRMKHRIVRYLRENHGFDIFSIEAGMPDAYRVDDYVSRGKGDPVDLIRGMRFWTWRTQEVLVMVEWMRRHNETSDDKIRFTGFDMQDYETAWKNAAAGMASITGAQEELEILFPRLEKIKENLIRSRGNEAPGLDDANSSLDLLKGMLDKSDTGDKAWTKQMLRVIEQFVNKSDYFGRDEAMAENTIWIKEHNPSSKMVLWAHNAHLQKTGRKMGQYLDRQLGEDYVNIGFTFHKGAYTAIGDKGLTAYIAQESAPGSFEYYFHLAGEPIFIFDLRAALKDDSNLGEWLRKKMKFRKIGAMAGGQEFWLDMITDQFDIIIFIDETAPSELLPDK